MASPPALTRSRSSFAPPSGKLDADVFDFDHFKYPSDKLMIVALDGSDLSFRALRLASFLMCSKQVSKGARDNVVVVNVLKPGQTENRQLMDNAVQELRKCMVLEWNVCCKSVPLPEGWTVGDALVYFANHAGLGHANQSHLVIGAQGADGCGDMSKMGTIAVQCCAKCKVPVTVVKGAWGTVSGDRTALGRPMRTGRDGKEETGLSILVCIDGTVTGHKAFDIATAFCREGDRLTALHVTGFLQLRTEMADARYVIECAKVRDSRKLASCEFVKVPPGKGSSISDAIVAASAECDLLVMGSVELANIKKRHLLGSVAMAITKRSQCHMCVVKNFA